MSADDDARLLRALAITRALDARAVRARDAGEIPFYLSCAGREAAAIGAAAGVKAADWLFPGLHQLGAAVVRGVPLERLAGRLTGGAADPGAGHALIGLIWSRAQRIAPATPNLGAHLCQAYGAARALAARKTTEVVLAFAGAVSAGTSACHQTLTRARDERLPLVVVLDGPQCPQSIAGLTATATDGELRAVRTAVGQAAERARSGVGPQLVRVGPGDAAVGLAGVEAAQAAAEAEVAEAWEAACQAGPSSAAAALEHVTGLDSPVRAAQRAALAGHNGDRQ